MRNPNFRFMLSHPAHIVSLGFGSGLSPKAPGTVGSLLAWALYWPLRPMFSELSFAIFLALSFALGCLWVARTCRDLGVADHGAVVWDEFVAVWLVLMFCPGTIAWQAFAVGVFRFFDIVKPWPIRQYDARLKNGFGVMLDDLLAAGYSLIVLFLALRFFA